MVLSINAFFHCFNYKFKLKIEYLKILIINLVKFLVNFIRIMFEYYHFLI